MVAKLLLRPYGLRSVVQFISFTNKNRKWVFTAMIFWGNAFIVLIVGLQAAWFGYSVSGGLICHEIKHCRRLLRRFGRFLSNKIHKE